MDYEIQGDFYGFRAIEKSLNRLLSIEEKVMLNDMEYVFECVPVTKWVERFKEIAIKYNLIFEEALDHEEFRTQIHIEKTREKRTVQEV